MSVTPNSQCARILRVLADGRWHSMSEIHRRAGNCVLHSRISDLRLRHGYMIEHDHVKAKSAALANRYRLLTPITREEVARLVTRAQEIPTLDRASVPRDPDHRYRIYRQVYSELQLVGTAKSEFGVGSKLVELGRDGVFDGSCPGLLDTHGTDEEGGTWILNPFDTTP